MCLLGLLLKNVVSLYANSDGELMIPLFSTAQIRAWDAYTIKKCNIFEIDLMEQASEAFVAAFCARYAPTSSVYVLAGKGNNGGDGICVARLLHERGYEVELLFFGQQSAVSPSCKQALRRWEALKGKVPAFSDLSDIRESSLWKASASDLWIDALWGTGLGGALREEAAELVEALNQLPLSCVSVDVPSGLLLDQSQEGAAVYSDHVIGLQVARRAFLLPENAAYVKSWETVDIGLDSEFLSKEVAAQGYLIEEEDVAGWLPARPRHLHKNEAGRGLLIAGSRGMFGASILSASSAMRGGAGAIHLHTPQEGVGYLHTSVPEVLLQSDPHPSHVTRIRVPEFVSAIAVGPGLGQALPTAAALRRLMSSTSKPLILDADALNILSSYPELIKCLAAGSLLTPHEGELRRLVGSWASDYEKIERAQDFVEKTRSTMLLKGAYTVIISPGEPLWFNMTGHPGMATAGSGDVLTGLLLALRCTGLGTRETAALGAFLHGRAADLARRTLGTHGLIARDIIDHLPAAFCSLNQKEDTEVPPIIQKQR